MTSAIDQEVTPYSTVTQYATGFPEWIPEDEQERVQAYNQYDFMYWNNEEAFQLARKAVDGPPLYLPTPRTIVNTTAHYLLKGLQVTTPDAGFKPVLDAFLRREKFYSKINSAKLAGVCRGDWVLHITADPNASEGSRVSLNVVHPGSYFPVYDDADLDNRIGVRLVEQILHPEDPNKTLVKVLEYGYERDIEAGEGNLGRVWREENIWELEGWNNPERARLYDNTLPLDYLPPDISVIPVYHVRNGEWDNEPFGFSDLKGFERIFEAANQSISDEDLALSLSGLGVYATDAGQPVDTNGNIVPWEIYPGVVLSLPGASMFKRVEGITSVEPVQNHIDYILDAAFHASGTSDVAMGTIDTNVAESGIALAIRFLPMEAKVEQRDQAAIDVLQQMFYDLPFWFKAYEGLSFEGVEINLELGEKLPVNRAKVIEELNNMLDRKVISRKFYRDEMVKLGYEFPSSIQEDILEEEMALAEAQSFATQSPAEDQDQQEEDTEGNTLPESEQSTSNNTRRVNESDGTEIGPDGRNA